MKNSIPALTPFLRSDAQGLMLARLYLFPDREFTLTELAAAAAVSVASTMREVDRLVESDCLLERRVGRSRLVRVNTEHALYKPMSEVFIYAYGPQAVIHKMVQGLANLKEVYIYGSWAARIQGHPGPDPQDVDVLLIGEISMRQTAELSSQASLTLGRPVNQVLVSSKDWEEASSSFLKTVKSSPLLKIEVSN